jgi:ureidoglycolate hydrolase
MGESMVGGDLVLEARPATPEAFHPWGRLLYGGDRARIGKGGRVLVALDRKAKGPRRVDHLQRYPEAARVVLSATDAPLLLVVCGTDDRPGGPPAAFRVPGGAAVQLNPGVWHAGPTPLADTTLVEMLEIRGATDLLDRRPVSDLLPHHGLRIVLPGESGGPGTGSGGEGGAAPVVA